jgi:hypothetical protein
VAGATTGWLSGLPPEMTMVSIGPGVISFSALVNTGRPALVGTSPPCSEAITTS